MSMVNPIPDALFMEQFPSPAPPETDSMLEDNPFPIPDALFPEQSPSSAPPETDSMVEDNPFPISDALSELEIGSPERSGKVRSNPQVWPVESVESEESEEVEYIESEEIDESSQKSNIRSRMSDSLVCMYDYVPVGYSDGIIIEDLETIKNSLSKAELQSAYHCAKFAVSRNNKHKGSKLEFLDLVKFNVVHSSNLNADIYYLTLRVKEGDGDKKLGSVYQAQVVLYGDEEEEEEEEEERRYTHVLSFRKMPIRYRRSKGVEGKYECDKGCSCLDCFG